MTDKIQDADFSVREFLFTEGLSVGERLPGERDLAARLGLGRAAWRAALGRLEALGVVRRQPQSGTFLAALPAPPTHGARIVLIAPLQGSGHTREAEWLHRVISALERTAGAAGAEVLLRDQSLCASDPCSLKTMVRDAAGLKAAGAILLHPLGDRGHIAHALALLHDQGCHPLIVSARTYSGLASQVYFDSGWGAYLATRHLLEQGHTRLGFAGASGGHEWVQERLTGYQAALEAAEIAPRAEWEWLPEGGERLPSDADGAAAFARWQALPPKSRPTGIVAANDVVALGLMAAAQAANVPIPEALSLVGFDNDLPALGAGLTTIERPSEALGDAAARTLLERLAAGENAATVAVRLRPILIERRTVGPPPL